MNAYTHLSRLGLQRKAALRCGAALLFCVGLLVAGQEPPPIPQDPSPTDGQRHHRPTAEVAPAASPALPEVQSPEDSAVEAQLRQQLVGKPLYLRGGYLGDTLNFDQNGRLLSSSPRGSYTLCAIEIDKVRVTKRKVELEGMRYGLHFLGALPYEDPTKALDRVKITPKKKVVRITIDRQAVVKLKALKEPKEPKEPRAAKEPKAAKEKDTAWPWPRGDKTVDLTPVIERPEVSEVDQGAAPDAPTAQAPPPAQPAAPPQSAGPPQNAAPARQAAPAAQAAPATQAVQAPMPDAPPIETGDATTSPAHAAGLLKTALDGVFAEGLDDRMKAAMPEFWKLYYQSAAARTDYRPADPSVLRQNAVDKKARLLSTFEPESNEYAQANAVAGLALYHVVIGADGRPGEIAVARPIGFGLDENAVASIRNAKFSPAIKGGQPVPVLLDLVVQFRIYSKRTSVVSAPGSGDQPSAPTLPGPYSLQRK